MTKEERAQYGDLGAPEWARRADPAANPVEPVRLDLLLPGGEAEFERIGRELALLLVAPAA